MERLTFKLNEKQEEDMSTKYFHFKYYRIPDYDLNRGNPGRITSDMLYNKLGELEDLEEELGCSIEVREQAFNNGFYDKNGNHYYCEHYVPYLKEMHTRKIMQGESKKFKLNDYKKTWWLKEDRSE